MTHIEAMKLALEALEPDFELAEWFVQEQKQKAITALRQAIEQAQQAEPVGYVAELIVALYDNSDPVSVEAAEYLESQIKQLEQPTVINMENFVGSGAPVVIPQAIPQIPQEHSSNESAYQRGYLDGMAKRPQPLSDEQIQRLSDNFRLSNPTTPIHFARAIERAHGIKG